MSGAREASPMEGVTGTMAWLSHVPGCSRAGLYGPANIEFFVSCNSYGCNEPMGAVHRAKKPF